MNIKESNNIELPTSLYKFSDTQKEKIIENLNLDEEGCERLENQSIYITPFKNDFDVAIDYLTGVVVNQGLVCETNQVRLLLGELCIEIDQKSEIPIEKGYSAKVIKGEHINQLFNVFRKDLDFERVLNGLGLNYLQEKAISQAKFKVNSLYGYIKKEILSKCVKEEFFEKNEKDAITEIVTKIHDIDKDIEENIATAIAIECYCKMGD